MSKERYRIIHDTQTKRFKLEVNSIEVSHKMYGVWGNTITNISAYTHPRYRGRGLAPLLMQAIAGFAKEKWLKIDPICSYAELFREASGICASCRVMIVELV